MKTLKFKPQVRKILADTVTPVSIYLRLRTLYPKSILLESSDYHGNENAYSFICFNPIASFVVNNSVVEKNLPGVKTEVFKLEDDCSLDDELESFFQTFNVDSDEIELPSNGLFGYVNFDAIQHFENIKFSSDKKEEYQIPEVNYSFYKYVVAIDHHKNIIHIVENLLEGESSQMDYIHHLLVNLNFSTAKFEPAGEETSNITDDEYKQMVTKGKEHCYRGDVFQIVLSRQFKQEFEGDDFNVYRSLRSINPSPYLFYFDFGDYRIFGSSPEAQIRINDNKAFIHPIAGTFKRTGNDEQDRALAEKLSKDPKENAEHVMLVDLARNDLSRNADKVKVETYREVQFYSHVIHLVSQVSGEITEETNLIKVLGETFPAGTLSGAPKYKAMELIDKYENQNRGYYGGCIGYLGFDRTLNHAIMIRSFLSKNNKLFYQAGAGIVADSQEESELQEVNNKLAALKKAIEMAKEIS
ncbi:MAG: anthranilate synthase component I family protein [Prolixibacteraceae bacterium]|jgi:anthranilate synthase component I|nr:anthranilate synthase component I family protein [Prolixibacteraceae bacterium]MBT6005887.1 anthranilate synthase component I family protein [Prolixibacteraceae bacterium]MBT6766159.1 anthranilate synthase component I family protein [Prolixibacteraceae bacterium]MBT6997120.1 anthranilate synthase component I family protein [Prolixibacteraceae bacterium]MBT7393347.1 anthranilate synthase component I family protein [Prolixibacteraceae bacterium]